MYTQTLVKKTYHHPEWGLLGDDLVDNPTCPSIARILSQGGISVM
jgi:hypothetical protein